MNSRGITRHILKTKNSGNSCAQFGFARSWIGLIFTACILVILNPNTALRAEIFNVSDPATFQAALNTAATNGEDDTLYIAAGTYNSAATLAYWSEENHTLTITGAGKDQTILDGGNAIKIADIVSTRDNGHLTVKNMTFRNGSSEYGGGLYIETSAATITVDGCEFNGHTSTQVGGGVNAYSTSGNIAVSNSSFMRNTSGRAAGLFAQTEVGMSVSLTDCIFEENTCTVDGGATMLYPLGEGVSLTVVNNHFENNQANNFGGGCWSRMPGGNSTMEYHNNSFRENSTLTGDGGGTYIEMHSGTMNYTSNTYNDNNSGQDGGGAWIWNETGIINLSGNTYTDNDAANNGGGASVITDAGTLTFDKNILNTNSAGNVGGGLNTATINGTLIIPNNTFYGNSASEGGGIYFYFDQVSPQADFANNILWHDSTPAMAFSGAQGITAMYSNIEGGTGEPWFGTGCIDTDPLFSDQAGCDFRLTWANYPAPDVTKSPCIDTGNPASPTDPDGTTADMGALYFDQVTGVDDYHLNGKLFFHLSQNYPNPFNPTTTIQFNLPKSGIITLKVYNSTGREIKTLMNGYHPSGAHEINWAARGLSSGIYFYRLQAGKYIQTRKFILQK